MRTKDKVLDVDFDAMSEQAEAAEQEAAEQEDIGQYTHVFAKPFEWEGGVYPTLTFDFTALTGRDSLAVETEMIRRGRTLVVPEFDGDYLSGLATRACIERTEMGGRVLDHKSVRAFPLRDFQQIIKKVRAFLLHVESEPQTAANGSENNA